jgi:myo-inositol 2-dehydrogenase/D-chiro-inositol 1-dehydrogenase
MSTTSICVIGAGRIGRIHASNIARHPAAELRYVVDVNEASARRLADETAATVASVERALADNSLDAVVIASSTDTHLPLIEACAAAGKAVFCEKPLDLDVDGARSCVEAAARAGTLLAVGFNRRYDPSFRRLRDEIATGSIGSVEVVTITSRDPSPPPLEYLARSGGLFRDMTIHDLDMARWLLGREPEWVYAAGSSLVDASIAEAGDIDTAAVILQVADGAVCKITNSRRCSYGYDQRIEVFGSEGMLRAGNDRATRVEVATGAGFLREPALPFFLERYERAYRLEIDDFVKAIGGEAHTLAGGDDGVRALVLAEAAWRSLASGQRVRADAGAANN